MLDDKISRRMMFQEAADRIRKLIQERNLWGQFLMPERELAEVFGISRDTLRRGLEQLEKDGLITRRQGMGTLVKTRRPVSAATAEGQLLIGCSGGSNMNFIGGITQLAGESRWLLKVSNLIIPPARASFISQMKEGAATAAILVSVVDRRTVEEILSVWQGPLLLIDHHFPDLPISSVMEDGAGGMRQAVEHLVERGHRRIGYVEPSRRELNPWKYQGYADALAAAAIPIESSLIAQAAATFADGQRAGEQLLALPSPPTAIVAASDYLAWGVWRAAELAGRRVGADLALVGYGDEYAVSGPGHEISSIAYDAAELGREAMRRIIRLHGGDGSAAGLTLIPTRLHIRASSSFQHIPRMN